MLDQPFELFTHSVRVGVEEYLSTAFDSDAGSEVNQIAKYAVLGGGHRWRAMVAVASGLIFDRDAYDKVLPGACGIELAHAASLILDDLPSMDNARIRRGKPCPHLVFASWAVDLAPVHLVMFAYKISLSARNTVEARRLGRRLTGAPPSVGSPTRFIPLWID